MRRTNEDAERRFQTRLLLWYVGGIGLVLLVQYLRSRGPWGIVLDTVLGSAPNFIAAVCVPPVFMLYRRKAERVWKGLTDRRWLYISTGLGLIVVVGWELAQTRRINMVFDVNDIVATVLGSFLWLAIWPWLNAAIAAERR